MKKITGVLLLSFLSILLINCNQSTPSGPKYTGSQMDVPANYSLFDEIGNKNYKSPNNVTIKDAENQSQNLSNNWWSKTGFYHIWIKSFADSDGDGCGDIKGIEQKLDYIQNQVGCDAIWLSPFHECDGKSKETGVNMHGYDVADFYSVNSFFGTEEDLISLINACHARGMQIIFDFVPNHTGRTNQWFVDSAAGTNGKTTWYLWSDTKLGWNPGMGTSDTWHSYSNGKYFYGAFGYSMPDLNYHNWEVREEMKNVVRYWLNKGFDGLRVDAALYLVEEQGNYNMAPGTHKWFKELRSEINKYSSPKFMVAEAWLENDYVDEYFGDGDEFNMVFDFRAGKPIIASVTKTGKDETGLSLRPNKSENKAYGVFLSNHDEYTDRPGFTLCQDYRRVGQALALSILRPNVPFIYYGNEVGQTNTSYDGDIRLRGPFHWEYVDEQKDDEGSPLNFAKNSLAFRKRYPDLFATGNIKKLTSNSGTGVLAYIIEKDSTKLLFVYNLNNKGKDEVSFSGFSGYDLSSYSCLVGDSTATIESDDSDIVKINNLSARAVRVYALGQANLENVWNNELEFSTETAYKAKSKSTTDFYPSSEMYLRGTMNSWGGTAMEKTEVDGDAVWTCKYTFTASDAAKVVEFKFCANNGDPWAASWGNSSNGNLKISVAAKEYTFTFNETKSANSRSGAVCSVKDENGDAVQIK